MEKPGPVTTWQRRFPLALIACGLLLGAAGLATGARPPGQPAVGQPAAAQPSTSFDAAAYLTPRIAIAYDVGGRGSAGFNQLAWEGVQRAAVEFDAEIKEITARPEDTDADREALLADLAGDRYYPIFAIGSSWAGPVATIAEEYPDTWFGLVDDGTVSAPKVIGILFNDEQGAFLVGAAAALTSETGIVGFVGADRTPQLEKFQAGFTAGALAADPDVQVLVAYLARPPASAGDSDPAAARTAALGMFDAGADVIFGADGESDDGVIQAAAERGRWAIGVGSDQYLMADPSVRDAILTSMLKRADVALYTITMEVAHGVPKDGNNVFGLDRGGVGFSTSGGFVDPIKTQLDDFAARIGAGEILVPTKP